MSKRGWVSIRTNSYGIRKGKEKGSNECGARPRHVVVVVTSPEIHSSSHHALSELKLGRVPSPEAFAFNSKSLALPALICLACFSLRLTLVAL